MILLPKTPKIINEKDNWGRFEIEGLYPGYGITIGNALRRVLLSSLEGAAVTEVKIKGVQHEFATIPGILEDVIRIMMNLKNMRFRMHADEPQRAVLKIKGEKEVKGDDFDFPSQVELINKNCHIATLTDKKGELEMEIQIEKGIGYEPVEMRKKKAKTEIGTLLLDAIYNPVKKCSFKVENMRVGERTDFDRLILEIETDGSLTPKQALVQATDILIQHFTLIDDTFREKEKKTVKQVKSEEGKKKENKKQVSSKKESEKKKKSSKKK